MIELEWECNNESAKLAGVFNDRNFPVQSRSPESGYGGHSTLAPTAILRTLLDVYSHIDLRPERSAAISREATTASDGHGAAVAISFSLSNSRAVAAADRKD